MTKQEEIFKKHWEGKFQIMYSEDVFNEKNHIFDAMSEYAQFCINEYISKLKTSAKFHIEIINEYEIRDQIFKSPL